ncbi:hypothetical protein [Cellulomonas triticagri]|nr:hypothetical protein [Cellulomonas triticagri]
MYDELLFTVEAGKATRVPRRSLTSFELHERAHLQEWVLASPEILGPGTTVVTSEYDRWQSADGARVADRLDILGLDPDGRLVVAELKRDAAPATVHMQAVNYAAMVSRLTPDDVVELYSAWHERNGESVDRESARTLLETEYLLTADGIRRPRIVLIASDFPASVTATVVWLNEQDVDISLIRYRAYDVNGSTAVSFSRLYPVPEVEEFTIGRRVESVTSSIADPGAPWDSASLARLAGLANDSTLALLDLCAAPDPGTVGVAEVAAAAAVTVPAVRGQLAGLTMRLRNPANGFVQNVWPVQVTWLPGGVASYSMDPSIAALWRGLRAHQQDA